MTTSESFQKSLTILFSEVKKHFQLLPSATKLRRLCFYRCVSVHRGGAVSQHAIQQVSGGQGVLSQYALQVVSQHALQQVSGEVCLQGLFIPFACIGSSDPIIFLDRNPWNLNQQKWGKCVFYANFEFSSCGINSI